MRAVVILKKQWIGNRGFSLIELLITTAIVGIVIASLINTYIGQQNSELSQEQIVEMQENIRAGIYIMSAQIRMAGYDPYNGRYRTGIISAGNGLSAANALQFTYVADDDGSDNAEYNPDTGNIDAGDGETDEEGETKVIAFYLYKSSIDNDSDYELGMRTGNRLDAIAQNILNVSDPSDQAFIATSPSASAQAAQLFTYRDANGNVIANPQASISNIRSVEISLTARVDAGRTDYTIGNATRTVKTLVQCRNIGLP